MRHVERELPAHNARRRSYQGTVPGQGRAQRAASALRRSRVKLRFILNQERGVGLRGATAAPVRTPLLFPCACLPVRFGLDPRRLPYGLRLGIPCRILEDVGPARFLLGRVGLGLQPEPSRRQIPKTQAPLRVGGVARGHAVPLFEPPPRPRSLDILRALGYPSRQPCHLRVRSRTAPVANAM